MGSRIDITGRKFGRWTVVRLHDKRGTNDRFWCRCECGVERPLFKSSLVRKNSSCGCYVEERKARNQEISSTKTMWWTLKGRGVCPAEWSDFEDFLNDMGKRPEGMKLARHDTSQPHSKENSFWSRNNGTMITIDGVTDNVRAWAKRAGITSQAMFNRINAGISGRDLLQPASGGNPVSVFLTHDGKTMPVAEWSEKTGISPQKIYGRLRTGWTDGQALEFEPSPRAVAKAAREASRKEGRDRRRPKPKPRKRKSWLSYSELRAIAESN